MDFEEDDPPTEKQNGPKKRFRKNKLKLVFNRDERQNFLLGFRKRKQERKEKYVEKLERNLAKEKKRIKQQTQRQAKKLSNSHAILPEVKNIIENMPEKEETYDLGNTLVSITSLDDQIYRNLPPIKEEDEDDLSEDDDKSNQKNHKSNLKKWSNTSGLNTFGDPGDEDDDMDEEMKSDPFFNPINDDELSRSDLSSEEDVPYDPLAMLRKNTESSEDPAAGVTKAKLEKEANRLLQQSEAFKKMQRIKQKRSKKFRLFRLKPAEEDQGSSKGGSESAKSKKKGGKLLKNLKRGGKKRK